MNKLVRLSFKLNNWIGCHLYSRIFYNFFVTNIINYMNAEVQCRVYKSSRKNSILSRINPSPIQFRFLILTYFFDRHPITVCPCRSSYRSFSCKFTSQNFGRTSTFSRSRYMPCPPRRFL